MSVPDTVSKDLPTVSQLMTTNDGNNALQHPFLDWTDNNKASATPWVTNVIVVGINTNGVSMKMKPRGIAIPKTLKLQRSPYMPNGQGGASAEPRATPLS